MSKDQLLEELAQMIREESLTGGNQLDERWEDLCADQLDADGRQALEDEAQCSDLGRAAWRAFQPPSTELQQRLVQGILAEAVSPAEKPDAPAEKPDAPAEKPDAPAEKPRGSSGERRRIPRSWRQALPWAAAAVLTVGVLGALAFRGTPPAKDRILASTYVLKLDGVKLERSTEPAEVPRWKQGGYYEINFFPKRDLREPVEVRLYVYNGETLERWTEAENKGQKYPNGAFELIDTMKLDLHPGSWELVAVVGPRGFLPEVEAVHRSLEEFGDDDIWQLHRQAFNFEAADP